MSRFIPNCLIFLTIAFLPVIWAEEFPVHTVLSVSTHQSMLLPNPLKIDTSFVRTYLEIKELVLAQFPDGMAEYSAKHRHNIEDVVIENFAKITIQDVELNCAALPEGQQATAILNPHDGNLIQQGIKQCGAKINLAKHFTASKTLAENIKTLSEEIFKEMKNRVIRQARISETMIIYGLVKKLAWIPEKEFSVLEQEYLLPVIIGNLKLRLFKASTQPALLSSELTSVDLDLRLVKAHLSQTKQDNIKRELSSQVARILSVMSTPSFTGDIAMQLEILDKMLNSDLVPKAERQDFDNNLATLIDQVAQKIADEINQEKFGEVKKLLLSNPFNTLNKTFDLGRKVVSLLQPSIEKISRYVNENQSAAAKNLLNSLQGLEGSLGVKILSMWKVPLDNYENTIHYVWMGKLDNPQNREMVTVGPQRLQDLINKDETGRYADVKIYLWVRDYSMEDAEALFSSMPNIEVRSFDAYFNKGKSKFFSLEEMKKFYYLMDVAENEQRYISQADAARMLVIAEFGGYYFDTTTFFTSLPKNIFDNNWEKRVGFTSNKVKWEKSLASQTQCPLHLLMDIQVISAPKKGDPIFIDTITCILKHPRNRFDAIGCYGKTLHKILGWSPPNVWQYAWQCTSEEFQFEKEGKIETFSVLYYDELNLLKVNASSWRSDDPQSKQRIFEKWRGRIGIIKAKYSLL